MVTAIITNRVAYLIDLAEQHERKREAFPNFQGGLKIKEHGDIHGTVSVLDENDHVRAVSSPKHPYGHIRELHNGTAEDSPAHVSVLHVSPKTGEPTYTVTSPKSKDIMVAFGTLEAI